MIRKLFQTPDDRLITLIRVVAGVIFFAHGAQKLLGWFGGFGYTGTMHGFISSGIPAPFAFLAIMAEFFGGLGLILGLLGRVAAFGIAVEMAVAVAMIHRHFGFFMNWSGNQRGEGFEYHLLVLAITIAVIIRGSGAFSLDGLIGNKRSEVDWLPSRRAA